ncbi:hypothetical protein JHK82_042006 [Glycine max]|nr:hypothetical protein JHK86_042060 [Glycine max]KAG4956297.1 hypothetical protein JHK85_042677 [Glycine max]KAG5105036.1 hypothetical protein JHK82_042006 [Glycine max]KAG5116160.1 hypothetical protein JHK84_042273 [Glycine max]
MAHVMPSSLCGDAFDFDANEKVHVIHAGKWRNQNPKTIHNRCSVFTLSILPMQYQRHLLSSVTLESLVDKGESTFSKVSSSRQSFLLARGTF